MSGRIIILLALLFSGCHRGHHGENAVVDSDPVETLRAKREGVLAELKDQSDAETGWPSVADCDATLWAGEAAAAGATWVKLELADHGDGRIERRPGAPCWTKDGGDQGSASSVSQDMLTGYMWGLWARGDLAHLKALAGYGERHSIADVGWIMGDPYPSMAARVVMRPNGIGTVGRMLDKLSHGQDLRAYRTYTTLYLPVSQDYERHIQALSIMLDGEISGLAGENGLLDINDQEYARLKEDAAALPNDALMAAALARYDADFGRALELLLDPDYAPPSYVRGSDVYELVHWLFAAKVVLDFHTAALKP